MSTLSQPKLDQLYGVIAAIEADTDLIKYLAMINGPVGEFVDQVKIHIFHAKRDSVEGIVLQQQLLRNEIGPSEFQEKVRAIKIPPGMLSSIIATRVNESTSHLLIALTLEQQAMIKAKNA